MVRHRRLAVKTISEDEIINQLPKTQRIVDAPAELDLLILAAGFEDRVEAIPKFLAKSGTKVRCAIRIAKYATNLDDNEKRLGVLLPILSQLGSDVDYFDAEIPSSASLMMRSVVQRLDKERPLKVGFDISGSSSVLIASVIGAIAKCGHSIELVVYYSTAKTYCDNPLHVNCENNRLLSTSSSNAEHGVSNVVANELFTGHHRDDSSGYVLAIPSLFPDRLDRCLNFLGVAPRSGTQYRVHFLIPSTSEATHSWRKESVENVVRELGYVFEGESIEENTFSAVSTRSYVDVLNYTETIRELISHIDRNLGMNVSVVHMGSKLQALAVSLVLLARNEVALIGARPQFYNSEKYSSGVGDMYVTEFPDLSSAIRIIRSIGEVSTCSLLV